MTLDEAPAGGSTEAFLAFAVELAQATGPIALPMYRTAMAVDNKQADGFDPVTQADRAAEEVMRTMIEERYPDHGILGEEFGEKAGNDDFTWILDPIDGTRSFISGTPTWMTLVGLKHDGRMIAGAAGQPFTDEIFAGSKAGAHLLHAGRKTELRCTSETDLSKVLAGTTAPYLYRKHGHEERLARIENAVQHLRFDADSYFHCMVAAGQLGISIDTGLQSYDIAALVPIVEGAGGIVTTWEGKDPGNGGDILVAANRALHEQAMALLA
ncbi:inositol monophosphatase family protein [Anderseniella sp. Alg231-50]|uniref:inositol monophosphatase family protein n=1 Tax=Anderseniella sp. Alg231-50 TaxID=1922226 RepID=UPI000D55AC75